MKRKKNSNIDKEEPGNEIGDVLDWGIKLFVNWEKNAKKNVLMLQERHDHIGKIMLCHLVIENLINKILIHYLGFSENHFGDIRLTFSQKIKLLPAAGKFYKLVIPGIIELNSVRNKIAHQLSYDVSMIPLTAVNKYLKKAEQKNLETLSVEEKINAFTMNCISLFSIQNEESNKVFSELRDKQPVAHAKIQSFLK